MSWTGNLPIFYIDSSISQIIILFGFDISSRMICRTHKQCTKCQNNSEKLFKIPKCSSEGAIQRGTDNTIVKIKSNDLQNTAQKTKD